MRHARCKRLVDFWRARRSLANPASSAGLPRLQDFMDEPTLKFYRHGIVVVQEAGDIFYDFCGEKVMETLGKDVVGKSMTFCYPDHFKALQTESAGICFDQHVGVDRLSRFWFGHRHKDVEWLLLPVWDDIGNRTVLIGLSATFVEDEVGDALAAGSNMVERVIAQDYLTFGREIDLGPVSRQSWAVLKAMGAAVTVNGRRVAGTRDFMGGEAAYIARKAAQASILAVAEPEEFGALAQMLGGLYNFRQVQSFGEAQHILSSDKVDILLTSEFVEGGVGLDLVKFIQESGLETACVLMLEPREKARDTVLRTGKGLVHCMVKPVGEFSLRRAIDDAEKYIADRIQQGFLGI